MLEIRLLGQFAVHREGALVEIRTRPAQSLFAYLALNPSVAHRREYLAGLLWPNSGEAQARRNLRQTLWQLRRALEQHQLATLLTSDDLSVSFNPPPTPQMWLDAAVVEADIPVDSPLSTWLLAVQAYGGELLPGFYEDWITLLRERLRTRFEGKLNALIEQLVAAQRWPEVLHWAEHWIAAGSTPEPAYRALMSAYAAQGDSAAMAATYQRCVEALQRELDVPPSPQTRALFESLSRAKPSAPYTTSAHTQATQQRHNLPVQLSSFVGREKALAAIDQQLSSARLLTLTGPGGTGKTRLALQAAQGLMQRFADGVWLVELARLKDPGLLPQTIIALFDIREKPGQSLTRALIEYLHSKEMLLILDNCEHVIEASAELAESLLQACPHIRILSTSREMLGISGESIFRIPSLAVPQEQAPNTVVDLAELASFESVRLLIERATASNPAFTLTAANAPAITRICRRLDGMPLAIELVAARIHTFTVEQIAARLDDRFRLLTGGSRTALPRHQTLRALIDWSWDLLTESEQHTLQRLSVFIDGWTLDGAEAICEDINAVDDLTRLVEKSLVRAETHERETRYSLLETIRLYANDKLLASGQAEIIRQRHLRYHQRLAEAAEPNLRSEKQISWLNRLDMENGNLRVALQWAIGNGDSVTALHLVGNLYRYWYLRGFWSEGREWHRQALALPFVDGQLEATQARIKALCGAGWLADEDGSEKGFYGEAIALSQHIHDRWSEAFARRGYSAAEINWSNPDLTESNLRQSLALFETLHDDWGIGLALYNLGWGTAMNGGTHVAAAHWQTALDCFRRNGDRWGIAITINAFGYLARINGDYPNAIALARESLALFHELGDKSGVATSLTRLGNIAWRRGDFAEAASFLQESLADQRAENQISDQANIRADNANVIAALAQLGLVASYQGQYDRAEALLQEGLALAQEVDAQIDIPTVLNYLALNSYHRKELDRAQALWEECRSRYQNFGDVGNLACTQHYLGVIALQRGDLMDAERQIGLGLAHFATSPDLRTRAVILTNAARLALAQGDVALACRHARASLLLYRSLSDKYGVARLFELVAKMAELDQMGDMSEAPKASETAETAVHLLATAAALRQEMAAPVPLVAQPELSHLAQTLRTRLGELAFDTAWRRVHSTDMVALEQATHRALSMLE